MSRFAELLKAAHGSVTALWRDRRGVTALEVAMVFPALVMIVLATMEFGRVLAAQNAMSHALGRAVRVVHLDATTTTEEIADLLEEYLGDFDTDLEVNIMEISGTSFMEISVEFPFETSLPFAAVSNIDLRVATLAPMVSPTH